MHYCCLVFTREEPDYGNVEEALRPFREEDYFDLPKEERDPKIPFLYDFYGYGGGGRFNGVLAMEEETAEEAKMANRASASLSEPLDIDYIVDQRAFCYVDPEGKGYAVSRFDYEKSRWIRDPNFSRRLKKLFRTRKDCWVTVVDIHD